AASFVSMIPPPSSYSPLSLHDALPISGLRRDDRLDRRGRGLDRRCRDRHDRARRRYRRSGAAPERPLALLPDRPLRDRRDRRHIDRKSTRLNSSHLVISYAVVCLKKKSHACITVFLFTNRSMLALQSSAPVSVRFPGATSFEPHSLHIAGGRRTHAVISADGECIY